MDAPVPLIAVALLAAGALVAPSPRWRAAAILVALGLAPIILISHIADAEQLRPLRDRAGVTAAAIAVGILIVVGLAIVFAKRPAAFPLLAVASLPFRIPISAGGSTANLLVPLYLVVAAGALRYVVSTLRADGTDAAGERSPSALDWALASYLLLYAIQAVYSSDFDRALENVVFFYVPFALLFALLSRIAWSAWLTRACLGVLGVLALALVGVGFVEYATRHLLLNPKVIASNQLEDYFRVNSLFFDPNIYGRFLAVVMVLATAWLLWARRQRDVVVATVVLGVLWAGLVLTFSQSSFASLLIGLAVLAALRWRARWTALVSLGVVAVGVALILAIPGALKVDLGSSKSADVSTSGRYHLIEGGVRLFADRPVAGYGSGSFARRYRRAEKVSAERATSASHTIPITIAAEQGVIGLLAYLTLLGLAFVRLVRGARGVARRAGVAAAFTAVAAHSLMYAAFLEDPLTWTLLGVGVAVALLPERGPEVELPPPQAQPAPA